MKIMKVGDLWEELEFALKHDIDYYKHDVVLPNSKELVKVAKRLNLKVSAHYLDGVNCTEVSFYKGKSTGGVELWLSVGAYFLVNYNKEISEFNEWEWYPGKEE